ncbi:type IV pilus twitching motility protein PilT [Ruminiclostridium cellobioparum]|jgi:twitching motility protein PilT|uniref:type IV pilus twitching motility protein PilT n=1 Tax=Ruminiclostridium cellobioparum TaxID=29355 RepID=UPI0028AAA120|nr:type IV pilus twitching motility protein PilT [Ruminiclostridium cellobioparum]
MELNEILSECFIRRASDVHITVGIPVVYRIHGELLYRDNRVLTSADCEELARQCLGDKAYSVFNSHGEMDTSYSLSSTGRFRVNLYKQRGSVAIAFRSISYEIPKIEKLGLPPVVYQFASKQRGLVLVTGTTGSGKSTSLAAMIDYINTNRKCHILTIEDPIEYMHEHKKSIINQREIGNDTVSYSKALRAALREDPDVILIGEMRDLETISIALTAAETGHLVFSTLHTIGAAKTIDRIIDVFPPHQQPQVRNQLSTILQGIISQQLIINSDGQGRVVATEVMTLTPATSNLIREAKTPQINSCIYNGAQYGMHSMDTSLANLYRAGKISYESACQSAVDLDNLKKILIV